MKEKENRTVVPLLIYPIITLFTEKIKDKYDLGGIIKPRGRPRKDGEGNK